MASLSWFLSLSVWERPSSQIAPRQCFPKRHLFCKSLVPNDFLKTLFFFLKEKSPFVYVCGASPLAQWVKNPPAVQEIWVWSLGQEDALKEGMATHSSILAWRLPWTEEPGRLQSIGSQRAGHNWSNLACTLYVYTEFSRSTYACVISTHGKRLLLQMALQLPSSQCYFPSITAILTSKPVQ